MKQSKLLFLLIVHPRIRLLPSNGTANGGRCGTADGQHRGGDQCGHPMFGHHRQTPLANRLPYTEDTETSIRLYCRGNG